MLFEAALGAVFVQVLLTFVLLIWMARVRTAQHPERRGRRFATSRSVEEAWTARATQIANCYRNQFELPVLFYAVVAFAMIMRKADLIFVILAWLFVLDALRPGLHPHHLELCADRAQAFFVGAMLLFVDVDLLRGARPVPAAMTPAARLSAAIEALTDIEARRRPAGDALKDWGLSHRFAGSGDRAAIAGLVYDTLRRRASSAFIMGDDKPRAVLLGMLRRERTTSADAIAALCDGSRFAPRRSPTTNAHGSRPRIWTVRRAHVRRRLSRMARRQARSHVRR